MSGSVRLPYNVAGIESDEDRVVATQQNFKAIEQYLGDMQGYLNYTGIPNIASLTDFMNNAITCGLEADLPSLDGDA